VVDSTVLGIAVAFVGVEVAYVLLKPNDDNPLDDHVISNLLVFLVVLPGLVMVYGLTCDSGKSFTSRALQLPAAKWLGSVSYSLYLSHYVVRCYVVYMFFMDSSGDPSLYSPWLILPLTAACLPLAWLLYTFVEEPSRRYLSGLGDGPQAPLDSGSFAWGSFGHFVVGNTERLSEKASDDGRAKLLESNQAST
jgi:peptidoglycan/LPS O-acetylase OafA/YrhL